MPKLTIGMPVYNGEECLTSCLEAILDQPFDDFVVLFFDNDSTDRTADIVNDAASLDGRIRYYCNDRNVGAGQNFLNSLAAAESEYFAWRADDDLSSTNYFQLLIDVLEHNPDAALAVGHVERYLARKNKVKHSSYVADWPVPRMINILRKMFRSHPSWIYGVWRTERLRSYYLSAWEQYPILWANDHLVLFNAILDEAVVGDEQATFVQRVGMRDRNSPHKARRLSFTERINQREEWKSEFLKCCRRSINMRNWNYFEKVILDLTVDSYARKRVIASRRKMASLRLRRIILGD